MAEVHGVSLEDVCEAVGAAAGVCTVLAGAGGSGLSLAHQMLHHVRGVLGVPGAEVATSLLVEAHHQHAAITRHILYDVMVQRVGWLRQEELAHRVRIKVDRQHCTAPGTVLVVDQRQAARPGVVDCEWEVNVTGMHVPCLQLCHHVRLRHCCPQLLADLQCHEACPIPPPVESTAIHKDARGACGTNEMPTWQRVGVLRSAQHRACPHCQLALFYAHGCCPYSIPKRLDKDGVALRMERYTADLGVQWQEP
mmetsp:Transcript_17428/g.43866  ORF Transcript_17428/g.43866 Transcript_17428/m.43866 type:complete len:252 (-) Transcript_17428:158-913(-)